MTTGVQTVVNRPPSRSGASRRSADAQRRLGRVYAYLLRLGQETPGADQTGEQDAPEAGDAPAKQADAQEGL